jgi:ankyrin repeat protein
MIKSNYFDDDIRTIESSQEFANRLSFSEYMLQSRFYRTVRSIPKEIKIRHHEQHFTTPCIPNGYDRFHIACRMGDYLTVQEMVQYVDIEITDDMDDHGVTPLHVSLIHEHYDIAKLLLRKGARVDAIANNGWTPLHVASSMGCTDMVQHLLEEFHADCMARDSRGWTPLFVAVHRGHIEVIKLLLLSMKQKKQRQYLKQKQSQIVDSQESSFLFLLRNERDYYGQTLLMTACLGGHVDALELLLIEGITNVDETDIDGCTAYTYAEKWKSTKWRHLVSLLEKVEEEIE